MSAVLPPAATTARPMPRPWKRGLGWLALLAPFFYLSYGLANHLASQRPDVPSLVFDWERQVPFWPWTIFVYWSINAFYGLSLLLAPTRHELDRHALRLLTAQCIAVTCFIAFPLRFSFGAPPVDGAPGVLFAALRGFDQPYNQAPSLHIALALILWDFYRRRVAHPWGRVVLHVWTLLICASVLTTWQHHLIDIPTGALLGLVCLWVWPLERRASPWQGWQWARDDRRRLLAAAYGAGALACALLGAALGGTALWLFWPATSLVLVALNYVGLGPRGFAMNRRGRMHWTMRWMLAPYRLGAWINGRLWTRAQAPVKEVLPGVWIASLARLQSADLPAGTTLVSFGAELQSPRDLAVRCLPALDLVPMSPATLNRAATMIEGAVRDGRPVAVACALGYSRSAAALACWLARSGRARDADEALAQIHRLHPQAVLGARWQQVLRLAIARTGRVS